MDRFYPFPIGSMEIAYFEIEIRQISRLGIGMAFQDFDGIPGLGTKLLDFFILILVLTDGKVYLNSLIGHQMENFTLEKLEEGKR